MRSRNSDGRSKKRNGCVGLGEDALDGNREDIGVDATDVTVLVAAEDRTLL